MNIDHKDPTRNDRDRFILSKGHAAPALFQTLALRGFFDYDLLLNADHDGTDYFGEHPPTPIHLSGIEAATGSLGHGLPMAVGMALAAKIRQDTYKVFVLVGDGECNEGSVWEAAALAGSEMLNNLIIFIDHNKWQATDRSNDVTANQILKDKFEAFGWESVELDGHNIDELFRFLSSDYNNSQKPLAVIANTVKGKGVSFMEDDNNWHYRTPNSDELEDAFAELGQRS